MPTSEDKLNPLNVEDKQRERERRESGGGVTHSISVEEREKSSCFEGSQAVPARPSGRGTFERG
jgi:hypothetical protein